MEINMFRDEFDMDFKLQSVDICLESENLKKALCDLKWTMQELKKKSKSNYQCPECGSYLYYDFIGEYHVRLYCDSCCKWVLATKRWEK